MSKYFHSHLIFSNLLHMPLGGKWQTILNNTYCHLKVIFSFFYIMTPNFLCINISYLLYTIIMCNWYTYNEIILHMLTGDIDWGRGLVWSIDWCQKFSLTYFKCLLLQLLGSITTFIYYCSKFKVEQHDKVNIKY